MTSDRLAEYADAGHDWLNEHEARSVLREYEIPCSEDVFLSYEQGKSGEDYLREVQAATDPPEFPVYAKVVSRTIRSISDAGGVERIGSAAEFPAAVERVLQNVAETYSPAAIQGVIATADVAGDRRELFLGGGVDPQFGTIVSLGVGGIYVEAYRDVEFRLVPIDAADVREMLAELEGRTILDEFRGMAPVDEGALVEVVEAFSQLLADHPEITEADINPLMAGPDGAVAADALIRLD